MFTPKIGEEMKKYTYLITLITSILLICSMNVNAAQMPTLEEQLFTAIKSGNVPEVKKLLAQGANINATMPTAVFDEEGALWNYIRSEHGAIDDITALQLAEAYAAISLQPKQYKAIVALLENQAEKEKKAEAQMKKLAEKKLAQMKEMPQQQSGKMKKGIRVGQLRPPTPPPSYDEAIQEDEGEAVPPSYEEATEKDVLPPYEEKPQEVIPKEVPSAPPLQDQTDAEKETLLDLLKGQLIRAAESGDLDTVTAMGRRLASAFDSKKSMQTIVSAFQVALIAATVKNQQDVVKHLMDTYYEKFLSFQDARKYGQLYLSDLPAETAYVLASQFAPRLKDIFSTKISPEQRAILDRQIKLRGAVVAALREAIFRSSFEDVKVIKYLAAYIIENGKLTEQELRDEDAKIAYSHKCRDFLKLAIKQKLDKLAAEKRVAPVAVAVKVEEPQDVLREQAAVHKRLAREAKKAEQEAAQKEGEELRQKIEAAPAAPYSPELPSVPVRPVAPQVAPQEQLSVPA
jgi:hypothetical protein